MQTLVRHTAVRKQWLVWSSAVFMYTIEAEQVPSTLVKLVPSKCYDLYESLLFLCAQVATEAEQILCKL